MNIDAEIAALLPMPSPASDCSDSQYFLSKSIALEERLALLRRVLQELIEYIELDSEYPAELIANARKVLEVTHG